MNLFKKRKGFYQVYTKRTLDFVISLISLILLSPLILVIALLVRVKLGSPVVFRQQRPGLNEKLFIMYKFRTMTDKRDKNGDLLPDEVRLTRFGKALRATSCDELLELVNILRGDMSIVGPRPLLVRYLPYYTTEERKRHNVRPGLTGLAQISGRNFLNWEERFKLDMLYVDNISFIIDLKIFLLTIKKVFIHENIMEIDKDKGKLGFGNLDEERKDDSN